MIGILNAYYFESSPSKSRGTYYKLITEFVENIFVGEDVRVYDIATGEWPLSLDECRVWIITGSAKGAYEADDWIIQLKKFIVQLDMHEKKLLGICFGHQVIAEALGGRVLKSEKGWGLGVKDFKIINSEPWMQPFKNKISLLFTHQDQVVELPQKAKLIASSEFCPNQMYQIGNHILTVQGHPEFSVEYTQYKIDSHRKIVSEDVYQSAMISFGNVCDSALIKEWFRKFSRET